MQYCTHSAGEVEFKLITCDTYHCFDCHQQISLISSQQRAPAHCCWQLLLQLRFLSQDGLLKHAY